MALRASSGYLDWVGKNLDVSAMEVKNSLFTRFAKASANFSGRPLTFGLAILIIAAWLVTGPIFNFSDTWQLIINTSTTIITFLMVFLIQNTQNRDTAARQRVESYSW